jgi:hypothetical protein
MPGANHPPVETISFGQDVRSEAALAFMPTREGYERDFNLAAGGVGKVDTWTAVTVRCLLEYHARYMQRSVTLVPPRQADAGRILISMLGAAPSHFRVVPSSAVPARRASAALVPAARVQGHGDVFAIGEEIVDRVASNHRRRDARFLAGAFGAFAENVLVHAASSPIGGIGAVGFDRFEPELQVVVADLGNSIASKRDAVASLEQAVANSVKGEKALASLVEEARYREIDFTLTLATGTARAYWRQNRWSYAQGPAVPGFLAAASIHQ